MCRKRTTPRTSTKETPFILAYGTKAMLPVELMIGSLCTMHFQGKNNDEDLRQNLDLIEEKHERSNVRRATYKSTVEVYYNQRVKEKSFKVGDYVLRKNEESYTQP